MSVKFEKETIRGKAPLAGNGGDTAHKIGEALTGGKSQTGYLAVSRVIKEMPAGLGAVAHTRYRRHISSNYSQIHFARKCSRLVHSQRFKKSLHLGSLMTRANMATISARECLRWQLMAH